MTTGRVFGWRALVPYTRVGTYHRTAKVRLTRDGNAAVRIHPPRDDGEGVATVGAL